MIDCTVAVSKIFGVDFGGDALDKHGTSVLCMWIGSFSMTKFQSH